MLMPMSEARLREAMRDRRYWDSAHPERQDYADWVTAAWQQVINDGAGSEVHVRAYERRGADGKLHHVQAHTRGAPVRAWENQPNPDWRAQIARSEINRYDGDFGYGMRGQRATTALGRYQPNRITLQEAGWRDERGAWTARAGAHGIRNDAEFLQNGPCRDDDPGPSWGRDPCHVGRTRRRSAPRRRTDGPPIHRPPSGEPPASPLCRRPRRSVPVQPDREAPWSLRRDALRAA